jgi:PIN domain nuclease of toxin-antitoxin system
MKLLVDTHILLWSLEGNKKLSAQTQDLLNNPVSQIWVSHVSLWEMSIKIALNKLSITYPVSDWELILRENNYNLLDFDFKHYEIVQKLPQHHFDPFDRMLIAQSMAEDFSIITQDEKFKDYELHAKILWN